ncbi:MAG: TetR/AcrR family transcriptional regulator [Spirochaetia bacterium]|nr:TetR/AcrR family transcriptional regulator [Spirochaetia bacterium]
MSTTVEMKKEKTTDEQNEKYTALLETGQKLFFKFGTKRVSVEEICQKADVSKMTFYKYFKDKNDLTKIILQKIFDEAMQQYHKIMKEKISFTEKIEKIIKLKLEKSNEYGDVFLEELLETNEELKAFVQKKSLEAYNLNIDFFKKGQKEGVIRKNMKPEFFMLLIEDITEMLHNEKLKTIIPDVHERFEELLNYFFYGIANERS